MVVILLRAVWPSSHLFSVILTPDPFQYRGRCQRQHRNVYRYAYTGGWSMCLCSSSRCWNHSRFMGGERTRASNGNILSGTNAWPTTLPNHWRCSSHQVELAQHTMGHGHIWRPGLSSCTVLSPGDLEYAGATNEKRAGS